MNTKYYDHFSVTALTNPWAKFKLESYWRNVAREQIENYYSKMYFEDFMKLMIYKDNKTVIDNEDDVQWLHMLGAYIRNVSMTAIKPFGRKFSAKYYNENFFFGWGGNELIDYRRALHIWKEGDGKYFPECICDDTIVESMFETNRKISEFFSPLLTQRKVLNANYIAHKLLQIIYGVK